MQTIALAIAASITFALITIAFLAPHFVPLSLPCSGAAACAEMLK